MNKNKKFVLILNIFLLYCFFITPAFSISTAVKAEMDYKLLLKQLRFSTIAIENFANAEQKKKFDEIKTLFRDASAEHYGQRYEIAFNKFNKVKEDLLPLLDELTLIYLKRSRDILDSTAKQAFDIIIKYSNDTPFAKNFKYPFDPIENRKGYDEKEYHFYYDRSKIENFLNNGYQNLAQANILYNNADFIYLKSQKKKNREDLNSILKQYTEIIKVCRLAKMYGIEIYKIFNDDKTSEILIKHRISVKNIKPVFDDRIPDDYKPDAADNELTILDDEKNLHLQKE
ncbi:MAG: hypothetical protein JW864_05635 [Spirochaetes bacterium]|nr:hypothetical protein [Spirochaetota bacterium]